MYGLLSKSIARLMKRSRAVQSFRIVSPSTLYMTSPKR